MICLHCGKTIPNIATVCSGCGANQKQALTELILLAQNGDSNAVGTLYEHFRAKGISIAKQYVKTEEDAEDVYQDSFLKAIDHLDSFDVSKDFGPWLNTIIANTSKNYLAKKKPTNFGDMSNEDMEYVDSVENSDTSVMPEESLDRKELTRIMDDVMADMPESQRQALTLYYYEEMSVAEVAKIQEVSEDTVKSRLNYGRKKAADAISKYQKKTGTKLFSIVPIYFIIYFKYIKKVTDAAATAAKAADFIDKAADVADAIDTTTDAFDAIDTAADVYDAIDTASDAADAIDTASDAASAATTAADFIDKATDVSSRTRLFRKAGKFAGKQVAKATIYKTTALATAGIAAAGGGTAVVVHEVQEAKEQEPVDVVEEPADIVELPDPTPDSAFEWDSEGTTIVHYLENSDYVVLPEKTIAIADEAFLNNTTLEGITFNENLRKIGSSAFQGCYLLDNVTLTPKINTIEKSAFLDCASLQTLTINSTGLLNCGTNIFKHCNIRDLTLSEEMSYIPANLFNYATFFPGTIINIPSNVVYIEYQAFYAINGKDSISVNITGDKLLKLDSNAFYFSNISSINLPESINQFGGFVFYGCDNTNYYVTEGSYAYDVFKNASNVHVVNDIHSVYDNDSSSEFVINSESVPGTDTNNGTDAISSTDADSNNDNKSNNIQNVIEDVVESNGSVSFED